MEGELDSDLEEKLLPHDALKSELGPPVGLEKIHPHQKALDAELRPPAGWQKD